MFLFVSPTIAVEKPSKGAVATAHPLATAAGIEILEAGGNAFDAAVAVTAAIGVVEPTGSGLGGGGFWLLHRASDSYQVMVDGREVAPQMAHRDLYLDKNGEVIPMASINGPLAAGIPGVPAAMVHIASKYGRLPLKQSLKPAIRLAQEGFKVDEHYRRFAKLRLKALKSFAGAAEIFLHENDVPPQGYLLKQPDLARTLALIADQGFDGFYRGEFARKLASEVKKAGGIWSEQDLNGYKIVERMPISGMYRGMKLTSVAPPSSGGIAMINMLNMLDHYDLSKLDKIQRSHLLIEVMRRAYRDRAEFLGDTDFVDVPVKRLTGKAHAKEQVSTIVEDEVTPSDSLKKASLAGGTGNNTTHFSVLDHDGNRVAATLSINYPFGACFVVPGTGFLLNDEMDDFSSRPGTPNAYGLVGTEANAIEPGKRPLSSMSPTFLENESSVAILGTPGGSRIITMVLLATLEFIEGGGAHDMVEKPRFHHQYLPDVVMFEDRAFSDEEVQDLTLMGHIMKRQMSPYGGGQSVYGNMQAIVWDKKTNKVTAASDPRGIGKATLY